MAHRRDTRGAVEVARAAVASFNLHSPARKSSKAYKWAPNDATRISAGRANQIAVRWYSRGNLRSISAQCQHLLSYFKLYVNAMVNGFDKYQYLCNIIRNTYFLRSSLFVSRVLPTFCAYISYSLKRHCYQRIKCTVGLHFVHSSWQPRLHP
jgi:hypothetical protein